MIFNDKTRFQRINKLETVLRPDTGGGQNLERRSAERLTFRNSKIASIKIMKNDLIDSFIIIFIFSFLEII